MEEVKNRYGKIVVIKIFKENGKLAQALGRCDCGKEKTFLVANLKTGASKSCGCSRAKTSILRKPGEEVSARHIFGQYRLGAKYRNLCFDIEFDYIYSMIKQPCYYCGALPSQVCALKHARGKKRGEIRSGTPLKYNGIDRFDNSIGYTQTNCVPCCSTCNFAKSNISAENFLAWLNKIATENQCAFFSEKSSDNR